MRKIILRVYAVLAVCFVVFCVVACITQIVRAQTTAPWQVGVGTATHTACTVAASTTQYCFASDGLWVSLNGAAYVQVQTSVVAAGVTSIAVNGGTPLTGAVTLSIPTKALSQTTSQTVTTIQ